MHIAGDCACHPADERLGEAVLYAAAATDPTDDPYDAVAAVAAVLWTADRLGLARHGETVTGAAYSKRRRGPAPTSLDCVVGRLAADGSLAGLVPCRSAVELPAVSLALLDEAAAAANTLGTKHWLESTRRSIPNWAAASSAAPLDPTPPKRLLTEPSPAVAATLPPFSEPVPVQDPPTTRGRTRALDEPLVDAAACPGVNWLDAYATLGILPPRRPLLRASAAGRLAAAAVALPEGFTLVLLDAWRTIAEQQTLVNHSNPSSSYVASVTSNGIRPPHTTGAAIDVTLAHRGVPLALGTDYEAFEEAAALDALEPSASTARTLRRLLAAVLTDAGFASYRPEWWHWSYGDDVWGAANHRSGLYDIKTHQQTQPAGPALTGSYCRGSLR